MNPILQPQMHSREADGLILAFQLVLTTTIMAGLGWWLDGLLGIRPVLAISFGVFTLAYEVWKIVSNYDATMAEHEARRDPLRQGPVE